MWFAKLNKLNKLNGTWMRSHQWYNRSTSCLLLWKRESGKTYCEGLLEDHEGESEKKSWASDSSIIYGCFAFLCRAPKEENVKGIDPVYLGCGLGNKISTIFKYHIVYHMVSSDFCKQPFCFQNTTIFCQTGITFHGLWKMMQFHLFQMIWRNLRLI